MTSSSPQMAMDQTDKSAKEDVAPLPKTTGEKWFKVLRFAVAETFILVLTAVIAFVAAHGKDKYGPVPNYLKKMQTGFTNLLKPLDRGETSKLFVGAAAGAMVTFHGGNLFAPVMKYIQNKKSNIVDYINKRWGSPGEVEIGKERLKDEEKETWGDVIKGRLAAFAIVFASFFSLDVIAGKDKNNVRYFDKFTERIGRWVAGLTKSGQEIAKTPIEMALTETQKLNKPYLFGKILALDVYATTAAIAIWTAVSKFSAMMRGRREKRVKMEERDLQKAPIIPPAAEYPIAEDNGELKKSFATGIARNESQSHSERQGVRPRDYRSMAEKEPEMAGIGH